MFAGRMDPASSAGGQKPWSFLIDTLVIPDRIFPSSRSCIFPVIAVWRFFCHPGPRSGIHVCKENGPRIKCGVTNTLVIPNQHFSRQPKLAFPFIPVLHFFRHPGPRSGIHLRQPSQVESAKIRYNTRFSASATAAPPARPTPPARRPHAGRSPSARTALQMFAHPLAIAD